MKSITLEWLKEQDACSEGLESFKEKFGEKTTPSKCLKWLNKIEREDWITWLLTQNPT